MTEFLWLGTATLTFLCFAYFMNMLYKVKEVGYYNYLSAVVATAFLVFSIYSVASFFGNGHAFEFVGIFLLLVLSIVLLKREVFGHRFH